ncbi:protein of unknown function [Nocardiopsis flavescens]|uniref:DUF397 domain-containing protein n=1 Tax=Nocardiopsis flavescens TaxID=758803 RepID=A0A1M6QFZ8_9ACTN|nr:DUF397 domain-containing protein [Nocardiopsis flavescens]SHK19224.1 protein of unknown function [Nocardiopsis flavescens]
MTQWRKSTYSATESHCVEVADTPDLHAVRDSKTPGQAPFAFDRTEWQAFLRTTQGDRR